MSRRMLVLAFVLLASPAAAQEPPEKLLSPSTQLFIRWDGITPHAQAYKNSALGDVMSGPTGDSIRTLLARAPKLLGANLLAEPLLDGKSPEELKAVHADLKHAEKILEVFTQHGVLVSVEVNEPRPTLAGIGKAIGGLIGGNAPPAGSFMPDGRLFLIVPDVGDKAETLFGTFRLLLRQSRDAAEPLPAALGRKGFSSGRANPGSVLNMGWWVEGKHFVVYVGSVPVEKAIEGMKANAAKGGITQHPLYQRSLKTGDFESVTRGYIDTANVVSLAKRLAGPFVPGLSEKLDAIGVGNLKAIVFSSGFKGKESRALYELDLPGERQGLAKIVKPLPVTLADLPPLPPDVNRFSMLRIDAGGLYDAGLVGFDTLLGGESGADDGAKSPEEAAKLRKAFLERELTKFLGLNLKEDLLPHLGDKFVIYQTPTEGLSVFGTVICISVKDGEKVKAATDRLQRGFEAISGSQLKLRRKLLHGVEIREVYSRGFGVVTPTYAVVGDWLVIAGHPQPVQGLVLRHKGQLEKWQPDSATAARLSKMPADAIGIQYCNPKSVVQNLCTVGPLFISGITRFNQPDRNEFDPIDIGLIPNAHELGKHLFPNLTYTRDDGKTVRIEVNDSFSLPLEFIGFEPAMFAIFTGLFQF
ncbi:MAG: hypothetical protein U0791_11875 [Gemmataceae bacterium]